MDENFPIYSRSDNLVIAMLVSWRVRSNTQNSLKKSLVYCFPPLPRARCLVPFSCSCRMIIGCDIKMSYLSTYVHIFTYLYTNVVRIFAFKMAQPVMMDFLVCSYVRTYIHVMLLQITNFVYTYVCTYVHRGGSGSFQLRGQTLNNGDHTYFKR